MEKTEYSDVIITKVMLANEGLKGIEVDYEKVEKNGERESYTPYYQAPKFPVHAELEKKFTWLNGHLLDICGYDSTDQTLLQQVLVRGITTKDGWFIISGTLEVFDNGKTVNLVTPKVINSDEYLHFEDVIKIIEAIYAEVKVYLAKGKVMDDVQYVLKTMKGDKNFIEKDFMAMTDEQKIAYATKLMEDKGSIIIHREQLEDMNSLGDTLMLAGGKHEKEEVVQQVSNDEVILEEVFVEETTVPEEKKIDDFFFAEESDVHEEINSEDFEGPGETEDNKITDDDELNLSFVAAVPVPQKSTAKKVAIDKNSKTIFGV